MAASGTIQTGSLRRPAAAGSFKLLLILAAAFLLVALPVLPVQFGGYPLAGLRLPERLPWRAGRLAERKGADRRTVKESPGPPVSRPLAQVSLYEQAAGELTAEIACRPQDPALKNRLGLIYMALGELERARQLFEEAVDQARTGIVSLSTGQQHLQGRGELARASAAVIEISRLQIELSAAHSNLARLYDKLGQHARVLAELDMLGREGSFAVPAPQTRPGAAQAVGRARSSAAAEELLARGEALMGSRRFGEALASFRGVLAANPGMARAHRDLGLLHALTGNTQAAIDELEAAVRGDTRDPVAHNNLGVAYQSLGRIPEAKQQFEQALAADPGLTEAALSLANIYASGGALADARQVLERALAANPGSAVAHNNLGTVLAMQNNTAGAIGEFRRALAGDPNMVSAHYGLGMALFAARNYKGSVAELKQALILEPRLAGAHEKIEQALRRAAAGGPG